VESAVTRGEDEPKRNSEEQYSNVTGRLCIDSPCLCKFSASLLLDIELASTRNSRALTLARDAPYQIKARIQLPRMRQDRQKEGSRGSENC